MVSYDGLRFRAEEVSGYVYVNNAPIAPGHLLSGSAVITLGAPDLGGRRAFATFDVSQPELIV